jgi:hypothetical protein
MSDVIVRDEQQWEEPFDQSPLYLQHYLDEREGHLFSEQAVKPPGRASFARVVERRGNLIVLEFRDAPPVRAPRKRSTMPLRSLCRNGWDAAILLLLLGAVAACVASFLR